MNDLTGHFVEFLKHISLKRQLYCYFFALATTVNNTL